MKAMVLIVGACMVAPLVGGFAGAAINTVPLVSAADPLATIPRHASDVSGAIDLGPIDAPDHYPLVTPRGTIPVEQLVFHGRPALYAAPSPDSYAAEPDPTRADDEAAQPPAADPVDDDRSASGQLVPAAGGTTAQRGDGITDPLIAVGDNAAPSAPPPGGPLLARR